MWPKYSSVARRYSIVEQGEGLEALGSAGGITLVGWLGNRGLGNGSTAAGLKLEVAVGPEGALVVGGAAALRWAVVGAVLCTRGESKGLEVKTEEVNVKEQLRGPNFGQSPYSGRFRRAALSRSHPGAESKCQYEGGE